MLRFEKILRGIFIMFVTKIPADFYGKLQSAADNQDFFNC